MNVARVVRYCRRRAGLTQRDLAFRIGVPQPAIARIESGRVTPRADNFHRILDACGFSFELRQTSGLDVTVIQALLRIDPAQRLDLAAREAANLRLLTGE
jgi:predicted transcriptional regulator